MGEAPTPARHLQGRYCSLRTVSQADYGWLYGLFTSPENHMTWRLRGGTPSPDAFVRLLWDSVLTQYVAVDDEGKPAGLVSAYQYNGFNRTVYLSVIVEPERVRQGLAFEALSIFVDQLFRSWDIRKVYAESIDVNYERFSSGAGRVFAEEGRLSEHEYVDGEYHDLVVLAISRERWQALPSHLRGGFLAEAPPPSVTR